MHAMLPRLAAERDTVRFTLFSKYRDVRALAQMLAADPLLAARCDVRPVRQLPGTAADLFWFPWNVVRPIPRGGPIVVTVHDAVPIALTPLGWRTWRKRVRWWGLYRNTVRHATILLTNSAFTADEIVRLLQAPRERIRVALLGTDDFTTPEGAVDNADAVIASLGVTPPYLLAVGADEPRKNFGILYRAMDRLAAHHPGLTLVRVGPQAHQSHDFTTRAAWMHRLGFISDAELDALYRRATAFVCPSTYEGFGLPVLEAMRRGAPVICSNTSSLPEVAGNAALYFDPADETALVSAIERLLDDRPQRDALTAAGKVRAAGFRWCDTVNATLAAFDDARAAGQIT